MNKHQAHVYFSGLVQGVFFRAHTEEIARLHGLTGWAKNLPDGRVEAVFEGDKESIQSAIDKCTLGPPAAEVTDVSVRWTEATGEFRSFSVRHF
jgi:acylphosphatase